MKKTVFRNWYWRGYRDSSAVKSAQWSSRELESAPSTRIGLFPTASNSSFKGSDSGSSSGLLLAPALTCTTPPTHKHIHIIFKKKLISKKKTLVWTSPYERPPQHTEAQMNNHRQAGQAGPKHKNIHTFLLTDRSQGMEEHVDFGLFKVQLLCLVGATWPALLLSCLWDCAYKISHFTIFTTF